ncbi:hypothetical protein [Acaryochloris sp. IP29b_bin.148]|uniref:hypothetical protein n=1 Tax=Acaryochloris sp. IP29b_bin.148 TaxID=2969218 RepID=UPI00260AF089|nr:hypothetical protein [Acaryochloris sp. IP29b_bin.148]
MSIITSNLVKRQAKSSNFWQGATLYEQCISARSDILRQSDFWYAYGYEFLGMVYTVYLHKVLEKINQYGIDHVMFVAREGYLFQRVYEILKHYVPTLVNPNVTTHYAYLSRQSTLLASTPQLTTREIIFAATSNRYQKGLWSIFNHLGLPIEKFQPFTEKYGIPIKQPISDYWNDPKLLTFLSDMEMQAEVRKYHQQASDNLRTYLAQCQFWGLNRKVALVDIGWSGTIQDNLVRAFNHLEDFPLLHGLYFGRKDKRAFLKYSNSLSHGLIYDSRNKNINAESIDIFPEIFEQAAGAPHASTLGYEQIEGKVQPIFKSTQQYSRQVEMASDKVIAVMQQGILDFAHQYGQLLSDQSFTADQCHSFVLALITRHISFPTYEEAHHIATQIGQQAQDKGEDKVCKLAITSAEFWPVFLKGNIKKVLNLFKQSSWRAGSFRLLRIPGLNTIYQIKRFIFF